MQDNLLFGGDETPSFYKLNKSLMEYESTLLALTALYQRTRSKYDFEQEKYDNLDILYYYSFGQKRYSFTGDINKKNAKESDYDVNLDGKVDVNDCS